MAPMLPAYRPYRADGPRRYDSRIHHRRSIRLRKFDYAGAGAYFVTIVVKDRACRLGQVRSGCVDLSEAGKVVEQCWTQIPAHFPGVQLDAFVVMPNHVHGIVVIAADIQATRNQWWRWVRLNAEGFGAPLSGSLPTILRSFKAAVTRQLNLMHRSPGAPFWQRGYHESVVRSDRALRRIRQYIRNNPAKWQHDRHWSGPTGAGGRTMG